MDDISLRVLVAAALAAAALFGYLVGRRWAVMFVLIAPAPPLAVWSVVVLVTDGRVWWEPSSYGNPAFLYYLVVPVALATAVGAAVSRRGPALRRGQLS